MYDKTVTLYDRQFGVLRWVVLIMVLLSVANSVNMSVFERVGEFGTMMALGNRRVDVFRLVILENVLIGVIGSAAGVLIGVALAWVIYGNRHSHAPAAKQRGWLHGAD